MDMRGMEGDTVYGKEETKGDGVEESEEEDEEVEDDDDEKEEGRGGLGGPLYTPYTGTAARWSVPVVPRTVRGELDRDLSCTCSLPSLCVSPVPSFNSRTGKGATETSLSLRIAAIPSPLCTGYMGDLSP